MYSGQVVFAPLMDLLPRHEFQTCVKRYNGEYRVREFSCRDQFLCMAYAQLTFRESLRDVEICLRSHQSKLYHAGFRSRVARSTLADANRVRDWRIYADFAQILIEQARRLYAADDFGLALEQTAYALDSTTIDLCLSLFPWATFRRRKAAIKLHTLLDLRGNIPTFVHISPGKRHDVTVLDRLLIEAGAFYVMDRGYVDFGRLYRLHRHAAFFITRAKRNLDAARRRSRPVDKSTGLRCDQTIALQGPLVSKKYPEALRRIRFVDPESQRSLVFLTNNFDLPALTIAQLYRCRWQVEDGFRDLKQQLGWEECRAWTKNPIERTSQAQWVTMSLLRLAQFGLEAHAQEPEPEPEPESTPAPEPWWDRPPWYPRKERPSVRDVVRLLRRHRAEILQLLSQWLGDEPLDEEEAA
jgi:hypothetical protein